jgi:hypothetical protein
MLQFIYYPGLCELRVLLFVQRRHNKQGDLSLLLFHYVVLGFIAPEG